MPAPDNADLQPDAVVPALRGDLQVLANANDSDGRNQWLVFDPLRHDFFEIDYRTALILEHWSRGVAGEILTAVHNSGRADITLSDIADVLRFVVIHELGTVTKSQMLAERASARDTGGLTRWIHNYLFFRVPIIRPHRFFASTEHLFSFWFCRGWWIVVALLALTGGFLVMRQWDEYVRTFLYFFSLQGMFFYLGSLVFVKALHELGHGYAATRYGCRVPTMGIAFLVLFPVLYTDTTDSWRVIDRKKRLIIDAAGIITELTVAVIATFLWAFMADGPLRSAMFLIATTSWLGSVLVNANPFMKFDGYHFLTDLSGIRNLQTRSFALGRWQLRELLFDLREPAPEIIDPRQRRALCCFAWLAWIYRLFLFLGIALLVYHLAFKALGIVLFAVEIYWFIARPVWQEIRVWQHSLGERSMNTRSMMTMTVATLILIAALVPWKTSVVAPVLVEAEAQQQIYIEQPGIVTELAVTNGQSVTAGDLIMTLNDPDLQRELGMEVLSSELIQRRIDRAVANPDDRDLLQVLAQQRQEAHSKIAALQDQLAKLDITAPIDGKVLDLNADLHTDRWVATGMLVAMVVTDGPMRARGYVASDDVTRLSSGARASFFSEDARQGGVDSVLLRVDTAAVESIDLEPLASVYGGRIATNVVDEKLLPVKAWYPVELSLESAETRIESVRTGVVHIDGTPQSILSKIWHRVAQVGIRELGL